ncbi:OmpA family protein [Oceanivirga salmonicida]|uniref:OmpA family protein n=1 Tax=Oceanivirga salmonicida TaxID=1769291 RepID=UPI0012E0F65D|nr:OmpA family protein [Oceanivirga salmonicida]
MEMNEKMRWLKRSLKNKYSITLGLMISFLVSGTLSLAASGRTVGGEYNSARGEDSIVVGGFNNHARGNRAGILGGSHNVASGKNSAVVGGGGKHESNVASGSYSAVVGGHTNTASSIKSIVVGGGRNAATGEHSGILAGLDNKTTGKGTVVVGGVNNKASGTDTAVIAGTENSASGAGFAVVVGGKKNEASGYLSAVVGGDKNKATSERAIVLGGTENKAKNQSSTVVGGQFNTAEGAHSSVLVGAHNKAEGVSTVIVGGDRNVAKGERSAVFSGVENKTEGKWSSVLGGSYNLAKGNHSTTVGGTGNKAKGEASLVAGGKDNEASGIYSAVLGGKDNKASGTNTVALGGIENEASGENAAVLGGKKNVASGKNSAIIAGEGSRVSGEGSVSIGTRNIIDQANVYVIGSNVDAKGVSNAVVLGNGSKAVTGAISVGNVGSERQIKHVKDGTDSTDAVNLKQLRSALAKAGKGVDIDVTSKDKSVTIVETGANGKKKFDLAVNETKLANSFARIDASNINEPNIKKWQDKLEIGKGSITNNDNRTVTGKTVHTYITNQINTVTNKGLKFAGNTGGEAHLKLGEKLTINGDLAPGKASSAKNVTTKLSNKTLKVEIATKPEFDEVTAGKTNNKVIIGDNKISLGGKTYITSDGINANSKRIKDVANAIDKTDAVNKGQLDAEIAKLGRGNKNTVVVDQTVDETKVEKITDNAKKTDTYKVGLADKVKDKLKLIGDGVISDTHANKEHTVTGKTVHDYIRDNTIKKDGSNLTKVQITNLSKKLVDVTSSDKTVKVASKTDPQTGKVIYDLGVDKVKLENDFAKIDGSNLVKLKTWANNLSKGANIKTPNVNEPRLVTDVQVNKHLKDNYYDKNDINNKIKNISGGIVANLNYQGDKGGKKTLDLKNGTFTIKGAGNIETTSKDNGELELKLKDIVKLGKITIDGIAGHITGLSNTAWDPNSVVSNRAATEGQLKIIDDKASKNTQNITKIENNIKNVVKYDTDAKDKITLAGNQGGTTITNLKDGVNEKDAVNKGQLDKEIAKIEKTAKNSVLVKGTKDEIVVTDTVDPTGKVKTSTIALDKKVKDEIARIGKGEIKSGDKNTVTGDTVHKYLKDNVPKLVDVESKDKTVIVKTNTDAATGKKTFDLAVNKTELAKDFAKKDASNLDDTNIKQWADKLSKDANIASPDTTKSRLVTDKQVHDYVKNNVGSLVDVVQKPNSGIEVTNAVDPKTNKKTFTVGLDKETKKKIDEIGTGKITETDEKTVSGKTVHKYIKDNTISKDGSNLTKVEITNLSKKLVGITSADKTVNVDTKTDTNGRVIYDLGVNKKALENDFARIDASNIKGQYRTDWRNTLGIGTGEVKKGDQNTVTGDTVHKHLKDNYYDKNEIHNQINKIGADTGKLSGGIATALAVASIPQVSDRHLVSVGAGGAYYNKAGGFAVGVSGTIPSRRFIYKVSAGIDTKKSFGVSAGINVNLLPEKRRNGLDPVELNQILASLPSNKGEIDNLKKELSDLKTKVLDPVQLNQILASLPSNKDDIDKLKKELEDLKIKVDEKGDIQTKGSIPVTCGTTTNLCTIRGFEVDGREPSEEEKESLRQIVKILNVYYKDKIIDVIGHTDNTASHDYNSELGLLRATNVVKFLRQYGLDKSIVVRKVSSRGETEIVEKNTTPQGRYMNRRVELFFTDK